MARSLRINYPGAFYHVTSRGNEQRDVFKSQRDREKFLTYLGSASERYGAVIPKKARSNEKAFIIVFFGLLPLLKCMGRPLRDRYSHFCVYSYRHYV